MKSNIVVKETLYLLIALFVGLVVLPWVIMLFIFPVEYPWPGYLDFLEGLVRVNSPFPWLVAIGPYLLLQLVRSVRWAMHSPRKPL